MPNSSNSELISKWSAEPAPLLPLLHAFHERDGYLSEAAIRDVSKGLRIPLADLFGTITFYHHFSREAGGFSRARVCTGPVCRHRGALEILDSLGEQATEMPCAGRCDDPVPVLEGDTVTIAGSDRPRRPGSPSPLPPINPGEIEECVFSHIRKPGRASLDGYSSTGGYEGLKAAVQGSPEELIATISESKLAGRGGAGFPTGRKWQGVREASGEPKSIVCNADEGEPGCFKDRTILEHDPHAVVEGMALAAYATGATRGFVYLRYEYPKIEALLQNAIDKAAEAGLLGRSILGTDGFDFDLYIRRGAGAYICGEETSLLNSLEGKHPFPRNRPPYPVTHGFENLPTVVNNVETLACVAPIVRNGAAWYQGLGMGEHAGTKVISLSGDVQRPGNYEVPIGLPLKTLLYDWAGGPEEGRELQAVTMAGLSGGFLGIEDFDATLDEPCLRARGTFLASGGVMVFDDRRDMVDVAHNAMSFFAHESCGKCFPCRIGTKRLTERLNGAAGPIESAIWKEEVSDIGNVMKATSACGLGTAAPRITESLLKAFPDQVDQYLARR